MFPVTDTAPSKPAVSVPETESTSVLSGSVSLLSTSTSTGLRSSVSAASSTAFGASLTPVMVTVTVAVSEPPLPSSMV